MLSKDSAKVWEMSTDNVKDNMNVSQQNDGMFLLATIQRKIRIFLSTTIRQGVSPAWLRGILLSETRMMQMFGTMSQG